MATRIIEPQKLLKMKTIKYILLLLPFIGMGQVSIPVDDLGTLITEKVDNTNKFPVGTTGTSRVYQILKPKTVKERQYQYVYSTIYLMDLYMEETKNDSIQVYGRNGMSMWSTEPAPKTFINFYEWTKKYFKDEKDTFRVVVEQ